MWLYPNYFFELAGAAYPNITVTSNCGENRLWIIILSDSAELPDI